MLDRSQKEHFELNLVLRIHTFIDKQLINCWTAIIIFLFISCFVTRWQSERLWDCNWIISSFVFSLLVAWLSLLECFMFSSLQNVINYHIVWYSAAGHYYIDIAADNFYWIYQIFSTSFPYDHLLHDHDQWRMIIQKDF